ncbi:MAG: IS110 family transposase [Bacteroidota bacterium]
MDKTYLRQAIGIDIGSKKLQCRHGVLDSQMKIHLKASKSISNHYGEFDQLQQWIERHSGKYSGVKLIFIIEATGTYHEELLYFLTDHGYSVCVTLPKSTRHFAKSLNTKTKNDRVDAGVLARMGLERELTPWQAPSDQMKTLKDLTRELEQLKKDRTRLLNQLHAKQKAYHVHEEIIERLKSRIAFIDEQIKLVETQIEEIISNSPDLQEPIDRIEKVQGLGRMTIISIIAETDGFALFKSIKQLSSYVGLDVVERQSGDFRGKTRISKAGNRRIRASLYFPAISASIHNPTLSKFYHRLLNKGKAKKLALTAVARKLLGIIYSLWKSGQEYQKDLNIKSL